jgi:hypothetical protein
VRVFGIATGPVRAVVATALLISGCATSEPESGSATPNDSSSAASTGLPPLQTTTTGEPSAAVLGASVFEDPDRCEDDSVGYRVSLPDAWWWNQPFDSEVGPHAQCRYFAPEAFDAGTVSRRQPIPEAVAIHVLVIPPGGSLGGSGEIVSSEELTAAGQPATRTEEEHAPGGILEPGERLYRYVIQLPEDRQLAFVTGNATGDYDENREVLDGMMQTLELFEPGDICGPDGDRFACGQVIVGLTDDADPIETFLRRNGGADADILDRLDGIRAYVIAVPAGTEGDVISRYLLDAAVEYAQLNEAEGGVAMGPTQPVDVGIEEDGIRVVMRLDRDRIAPGGRIWAAVVVENIGADNVYWGHSGTCKFVASVTASPRDDRSIPYRREDWGGIGGTFKELLVQEQTRERSFSPWVDVDRDQTMGCTTDLVVSEIRPGQSERHQVAWDGDGPHEMPALPGTYEVTGTFAYFGRGSSRPSTTADPSAERITVESEVTVVDSGRDSIAPGEAADAALADDRFAAALSGAPRERWLGSQLWFEDGRWYIRERLREPDEDLMAVVDATTGEIVAVELKDREGEG